MIAGSLPVAIVGLLAKDLITGPLRNLWVVAARSSAVERGDVRRRGPRPAEVRRGASSRCATALIIGLVQCAALVPGVSRSGATISAGLLRTYTRVAATRLSFFLAIPALTGAGLYELKDVDTVRRRLGAARSSARWSASSSPTPRSPGCCATWPATRSRSSSGTASPPASCSPCCSPRA